MKNENKKQGLSLVAQFTASVLLTAAVGCGSNFDEDSEEGASALSAESGDEASALASDSDEDTAPSSDDGETEADRIGKKKKKKCEMLGDLHSLFRTFDTAAQGGSPDGIVSFADVVAASRKDATKVVANFLISHPEVWSRLDVAAKGGEPDSKMSRADLAAYRHHNCLIRLEASDKEADDLADVTLFLEEPDAEGVDEFEDNVQENDLAAAASKKLAHAKMCLAVHGLDSTFDVLDTAAQGGSRDGITSTSDLDAIVKRRGDHDYVAGIAKYFLRHPRVWNRLDVAAKHDTPDHKVSTEDVKVFYRHQCSGRH